MDELEPPWAKYPEIIHGSIGWRMGGGEHYAMRWGDFVRSRLSDEAAFVGYLKRHPAAPRTWRDALVSWFAKDDEDDDYETVSPRRIALRARVADEGLIGDDVAYPVFVRNAVRAGGVAAPWTVHDAEPRNAFRYGARELGWWARWLVEDCRDRAAWWGAQPSPPAGWATIAAAVRAGIVEPPWRSLDGGAERLIPLLAVHGTLPPPWLGSHPPIVGIDWNDDPDDRDRWAWWAFETFEDAASWHRYLDRWPPPPPWRDALDTQLFPELVSDSR